MWMTDQIIQFGFRTGYLMESYLCEADAFRLKHYAHLFIYCLCFYTTVAELSLVKETILLSKPKVFSVKG